MPYDERLADRVREYLIETTDEEITEKPMFGGLAFLVNGKMCINISSNKLMCRFDPERTLELSEKLGFEPMVMRGKSLQGYGLINLEGYTNPNDFEFWMRVSLDFNPVAETSKKSGKRKVIK